MKSKIFLSPLRGLLWLLGGIVVANTLLEAILLWLEISNPFWVHIVFLLVLIPILYVAFDQEKKISYLAYHDALTGLPNRILFHDRFTIALAHAHRNQHWLAILFLDLDQFKSVNDTFGHDAGDLLLKNVALRLIGSLRASDTVFHMGGDEFVVMLTDIAAKEEAAEVAHRVLHAFVKPFTLHDGEILITPSIGISLYPFDGDNLEALIKNADAAMYQAKEQGKNNYRFYSE
jgi:diguanylate cyclase (GGDEF)-like protein